MEYDNFLPLLADYLPEPLDQNSDFINYISVDPNLLDQFADQFLI